MPENIQTALNLVREQCVPDDEDVTDDLLLRDAGALLIVARVSEGPQDLLDALKLLRDYRFDHL